MVFGADHIDFPAGLGAQALQGPFPDLLADPGQIGREQAFPPQELSHRLIGTLRLQVNLVFLLGAEVPPLLLFAGRGRLG